MELEVESQRSGVTGVTLSPPVVKFTTVKAIQVHHAAKGQQCKYECGPEKRPSIGL